MSNRVVCLRPEADFLRVGVTPPRTLAIEYAAASDQRLAVLLRDADALVLPAVGPKLLGSLFEGSGIKLVQVTGAGVDRLDEDIMRRLEIPVANVPGASNDAVAEYVVATALVLLRQLAYSDQEIRRGRYGDIRARIITETVNGLAGLTVGVIGLGTIGEAVAAAVARLGARVVYFDPKPRDPAAAADAGFAPMLLADLLKASDVVTLHVPLLPETTGLIGAAELDCMKPGAILINAARGGIVDERALARALAAGKLGGAAVDVFETEPPPADHPLLILEGRAAARVLLTPHIAGVTRQAWLGLFTQAWQNVERVVVHGLAPLSRVF
jgi:phosphoglycerate dehydrogenase-like enzyme